MGMTHPTIVDDSGLGTDGTVWNNAWETSHDTAIDVAIAAAITTAVIVDPGVCEGRLTLATGVPVTDVTGATTVYFTPYQGSKVALYSGSTWSLYTLTERSLALGTLTNDLPYDVFLYNNSGTLTLEFLAWTNKTTRATALVAQDGVLSKTGALTRRYLGTFHTTATTTTEDSLSKRFLWNYYNRVPRELKRFEAAASWTYQTTTVRQANANTANKVSVVVGVAEVALNLNLAVAGSSAGTTYAQGGIGEDSTTTIHASCIAGAVQSAAAAALAALAATLNIYPAVGTHDYNWLEWAQAASLFTFWQTGWGAGSSNNSGLTGRIDG